MYYRCSTNVSNGIIKQNMFQQVTAIFLFHMSMSHFDSKFYFFNNGENNYLGKVFLRITPCMEFYIQNSITPCDIQCTIVAKYNQPSSMADLRYLVLLYLLQNQCVLVAASL